MLLLLSFVTGSLAVWSVILMRWSNGEPALPFRDRNPIVLRAAVVILAGLIWFGMRVFVASLAGFSTETTLRNVQASCASNGLTLLAVWTLLRVFHGRDLAELGLRLHEPAAEAANGALGFLASVWPVITVLIATSFLRDPSRQHAFLQLLKHDMRTETILWITIAVTLFAPLTEELLFRVILQGALQTRVAPPYAIALTAAAFSAIHGWPDSLGLLPLAVILGYVFYRRNSYMAVVILHALFNLANLLMALLTV